MDCISDFVSQGNGQGLVVNNSARDVDSSVLALARLGRQCRCSQRTWGFDNLCRLGAGNEKGERVRA